MADYNSRYTGEEVDERLGLAETALQEQAQADWEQTDDTAPDYIKNKPDIPDEFIAEYGVTTYAEITAALSDGKTVTMNRDGLIYGYCGEDIRHSYRFAALLGGLVGQGEPNVSAQLCLVSSTDEWTNTYAMILTRSDIVTSMNAQSTNTQIPGAKAVYDAIQAAGSDGAVMYDVAQELNDTQKAQARTNIGAGTYSKPSGGIPASDLASGVIPTVPVQDVTVGGTSVVSSGTAVIPAIPSAPGTLNTNNTSAQTAKSSEALSGTIKLHKVSKTGSYNDLLDKPTIPAAQIQSDWDQSDNTALDYIKNKPTIPDTSNFVQKSQTAGLLKNDGTVDTTVYGTYSKPSGGIPSSDMASAVQTSLGKADTAYQKPPTGIPASDLASGVIPDDYVSTSDVEEVQDVEATLAAVALRKTAQTLTAAEKAQVHENLGIIDPEPGGTPQASVIPANGLAANVYYELGELSADLSVTLDSTTEESGKLNIYTLAFSMGATARNVTLPSVLWPGGTAPTFEAGMSYEIQFVNGRGTFLSFE